MFNEQLGQPAYSKDDIIQYLNMFKQSPRSFNREQGERLEKYADYYGIAYDKDEFDYSFSIVDGVKQLAEGFFSGFTTIEIGKPSLNPYENILRSIGGVAGFVGYVPAKPISLAAKGIGISARALKLTTKAISFADKLSDTAKTAKALSGIKSAPMFVAEKATVAMRSAVSKSLQDAAMAGSSKALGTVTQFLTNGTTKHVLQGAFRLGVASSVSNWQHGVDQMWRGFVRGSLTGGFSLGIAEAFQSGMVGVGKPIPLSKMQNGKPIWTKLDPAQKADMGMRMIANSLWDGLPSTLQGASAPEQVYNYLLGAYFGYKDVDSKTIEAQGFLSKYSREVYRPLNVKGFDDPAKNPNLADAYNKLSPGARKLSDEYIADEYAIKYTSSVLSRIASFFDKTPDDVMQSLQDTVVNDISVARKEGKPFDKSDVGVTALDANKATIIDMLNKRYESLISEVRIASISEENEDIGNFLEDVVIDNPGQKYYSKFVLPENESFDTLNTKHINEVEIINSLWDKYQPYNQKEDHVEEFLTDLNNTLGIKPTQEDVKFWRLASHRRRHDVFVPLIEFNDDTKEIVLIKNGVNLANDKVMLRRTEYPESLVFKNEYKLLNGSDYEDAPLRILKSGVVAVNAETGRPLTFEEQNLRSLDPNAVNVRYKTVTSLSKFDITDKEMGRIISQQKEEGFYFFSGRNDKGEFKFVRLHPKVSKMNNIDIFRIFNSFDKSLDNIYSKDMSETISRLDNSKFTEIDYKKMVVSNIFYEMSLNGFDAIESNIPKLISEDNGLVKTPIKWNKRTQPSDTTGYPVEAQVLNTILGRASDASLKGLIFDDIHNKGGDLADIDSPATDYPEIWDGRRVMRSAVFDAIQEVMGLPNGGLMKEFIYAPDSSYGALKDKAATMRATPSEDRLMEELGVDYLLAKSTAKQSGTRKFGKLSYNSELHKYEISGDPTIFDIKPEDVRVITSKKYDKHLLEDKHIAKQAIIHLNPTLFIDDDLNPISPEKVEEYNRLIDEMNTELMESGRNGNSEWNEALLKYSSDPDGNADMVDDLVNHIDDIGIKEISDAVYNPKNRVFTAKFFKRLLNMHDHEILSDSIEDGTVNEDTIRMLRDNANFKTSMDRMIDLGGDHVMPFLHKFTNKGKLDAAFNAYISKRIVRPIVKNSFEAVIGVYDPKAQVTWAKELMNNDEIYYLGRLFRDKKVKSKVLAEALGKDGSYITLGEAYDNFQNYTREQKIEYIDVMKALVIRVPMDSPSGAQYLKFAGFSDRDDYGILLHPRTMRAEGGADSDGDTAHVYLGGDGGFKTSWKKMYHSQKYELGSIASDNSDDFKGFDGNRPASRIVNDGKLHNHSGAAPGADTIWSRLLKQYFGDKVQTNHYRPPDETKRTQPKYVNTASESGEIISITPEENEYGKQLNETLGNRTHKYNNRNVVQILNAEQVFATGKLDNTGKGVSGGTGSAIKMAKTLSNVKDIYVLNTNDTKWYKYNKKENIFKVVNDNDVRITTDNIAMIGTRDIDVYWKSINGHLVRVNPMANANVIKSKMKVMVKDSAKIWDSSNIKSKQIADTKEISEQEFGKKRKIRLDVENRDNIYTDMLLEQEEDSYPIAETIKKENLHLSPFQRFRASQASYKTRELLPKTVAMKSFIISGYSELIASDKSYDFDTGISFGDIKLILSQTPRRDRVSMYNFKKLSTEAIRLSLDPADHGPMIESDEIVKKTLSTIFKHEFFLFNSKTGEVVSDSPLLEELKEGVRDSTYKKGITSVVASVNSALYGKNKTEGRRFNELERIVMLKEASKIFGDKPVSFLGKFSKVMADYSYSTNLLNYVSSSSYKKMMSHFVSDIVQDKLSDFSSEIKKYRYGSSDFLEQVLETKFFQRAVKESVLFESNYDSLIKIMNTSQYKAFAEQAKLPLDLDNFLMLNEMEKAKALDTISDVANQVLTNDFTLVSQAYTINSMIKEFGIPEQRINDLMYAADQTKLLLKRKGDFPLFSQTDVFDSPVASNTRVVDNLILMRKLNLSSAESAVFDQIMLSPFGSGQKLQVLRNPLDLASISNKAISIMNNRLASLFEKVREVDGLGASVINKPQVEQVVNTIVEGNEILSPKSTDWTFEDPVFIVDGKGSKLKVDKSQLLEDLQVFKEAKETPLREDISVEVSKLKASLSELPAINMQVLPGLYRGLMDGKDIKNMNLRDLKTFNNKIKQIAYGGSSSEIKKSMYMLFPREVADSMLKHALNFKTEISPYIDSKGNLNSKGYLIEPVHPIHEIQEIRQQTSAASEYLRNSLQRVREHQLSPIYKATGDKLAQLFFKASVGEIEYDNRHETGLSRSAADEYSKNKNIADNIRKLYGDKEFVIIDDDNVSTKITGNEIVDKFKKINQEFAKMSERLTYGTKEAKDEYFVKRYLVKDNNIIEAKNLWFSHNQRKYMDFLELGYKPEGEVLLHGNGEPVYNFHKFAIDRSNALRGGKKLPGLALGIQGRREMKSSMLKSIYYNKPYRLKALAGMNAGEAEPRENYFPHTNFDKKRVSDYVRKVIKFIEEDPNLTGEQKKVKITALAKDFKLVLKGNDEINSFESLIENLENTNDNDITWVNSLNQTKSMKKRNITMIGWDTSASAWVTHFDDIANLIYRLDAQIIGHKTIFDNYYKYEKQIGSDAARAQSKFYRKFMQGAMGLTMKAPPNVVADKDLAMKGTLFEKLADDNVAAFMTKVARKLGLLPTPGKEDTGDGTFEVRHSLKKYEFTDRDMVWFSNIEAQYELATVLCHPKVYVNNIYGGEVNTVINAGFDNLKKARNLEYLSKINPKWKNFKDLENFAIANGVVEEFIMHQVGLNPNTSNDRYISFVKEVVSKIKGNFDIEDASLFSIAKKYQISDAIVDKASWFMRRSERLLRRDSYIAHYIQAYENYGSRLPYDHPILLKLAFDGVKATQFLYSAQYRPMFANTAAGKVLTRFQLWAWNNVRLHREIIERAYDYGYNEGTQEYDRFKRMAAIDIFSIGLANAFTYSVFNSALPAPFNWMQDFAEWIFGDDREKERAFYGSYPTSLAPLQLLTPPVGRMIPVVVSAMVRNDFSRVAGSHIWTMFPFGRIGRDIFGQFGVIKMPNQIVEKTTGIPIHQFSYMMKKDDDKF